MKILIVDDSRAMRMIVKRTLRQAGFGNVEVSEACNGSEGLEKVLEWKPDLVLSDWNMPVLDGIGLLESMRDEDIEATFGFVTAQGTPEMKQRARAAGASFFITKPITVAAFQKNLKQHIP